MIVAVLAIFLSFAVIGQASVGVYELKDQNPGDLDVCDVKYKLKNDEVEEFQLRKRTASGVRLVYYLEQAPGKDCVKITCDKRENDVGQLGLTGALCDNRGETVTEAYTNCLQKYCPTKSKCNQLNEEKEFVICKAQPQY